MTYSRVFDLIRHQLENDPKPDSLCKKVSGQWVKYSTQDVINEADKVSKSLIDLGLQPGDRIGLIANNRPEWNFVDIGAMQIGVTTVPIYPTISAREYQYILNDAAVKYVFLFGLDHVEGRTHPSVHEKIQSIKSEVPSLVEIFGIDPLPGLRHMTDIQSELMDGDHAEIKRRSDSIQEDDLATLIYTSGTTGDPKGVMLSHKNLVSNVQSVSQVLPLAMKDRALSFLPLCHSFERTVSNCYLANSISIYYAENLETIGDNLREIKPHYFSTVPRLLEKVYERIIGAGMDLEGFKKKLFFWAVDVGSQYDMHRNQGLFYNIKLSIARKLIFSKWQEALGGEVEAIVTGAAAIQPRLATLFTAAGIDVLEGYGLTETAPVLSCNMMEDRAIGTIGLPIPGVEIRLDPDNDEIQAKGPNIMKGYLNKPEATAQVFTEDGWFKTGDAGAWVDPDGNPNPQKVQTDKHKFLKITDRIKELFKTSGGKYVAPQALENKFKESLYIEQMAVIGNNRKFVSALIVPSFIAIEDWCEDKDIDVSDRSTLLKNPKIVELIQGEVSYYNDNFAKVEQVKRFTLVPSEWSPESGELTPTMKPKRRVINERYQDLIEAMYAS